MRVDVTACPFVFINKVDSLALYIIFLLKAIKILKT